MPYLPPAYVSESIANNVEYGVATEEIFLRNTTDVQAQSLDDDDVCGVCLISLKEDHALRNYHCMHVFHAECIDQLLSYGNKCPMCRAEWYCADPDTALVTGAILDMLEGLECMGEFQFKGELPLTEDWSLGTVFKHVVLLIAHCMQVQDSNRRDMKVLEAARSLLDPIMRAHVLECQALGRKISSSQKGYLAVECIIRRMEKLDLSDIERQRDRDISPFIARLVKSIAEDYSERSHRGREMNDAVRWFTLNIVTWTLHCVCKAVFDRMDAKHLETVREVSTDLLMNEGDELILALQKGYLESIGEGWRVEVIVPQEPPMDLLYATERDKECFDLLEKSCPALC